MEDTELVHGGSGGKPDRLGVPVPVDHSYDVFYLKVMSYATRPLNLSRAEDAELDALLKQASPDDVQYSWPDFSHHMLVLELVHGLRRRYILAEKITSGIRISWYSTLADLHKDEPTHTIKKKAPACKALSLRPLQKVLLDFDPIYNLFTSNCQHYAHHMWNSLLKEA